MLSVSSSLGGKDPAVKKIAELSLVAAACGVAALAVLYPIVNTDIWWHLAAGRQIVQEGAFLRSDTWSSTTSGPWIDLHWGFQLLAFALYEAGGLAAIVVAKAAAVAAGLAICYGAVRDRADPLLALWFAALAAASVWCARSLLMARPVVISLLFISLFVFVLERYRAGKSRGLLSVAALPVLQIVWSNVQPVFVLGWVIVACYLAGAWAAAFFALDDSSGAARDTSARQGKVLALVTLGCVAASLVTPYGIEGLRVPFALFFRIDSHGSDLFSLNVSENVSPLLLEQAGQASLAVSSFKWISALVWVSFLLPPRRIDLARVGALAALFVTALLANRNILVFFWLAVPYGAFNLAASTRRAFQLAAHRKWVKVTFAGFLSAALLWVAFLAVRQFGDRADLGAPAPFRVPVDCVSELERLTASYDRPVHVFTSARYGGFLIWRFGSEVRVVMDGRFILRSPKAFASYLEAVDHPEAFDALARGQRYDAVLVPVSHPQRYQRLVRHLGSSEDWALTQIGEAAVLFVSRPVAASVLPLDFNLDLANPAEADRAFADIERRYLEDGPAREQALINLARIHYLLGNEKRALVELERVKRPDARILAGRISLARGEHVEAIAQARTAMAVDEELVPQARLLLAEVALAESNPAEALVELEAVLESRPGHKRARALVEQIGFVDAQ